MTLNGATIPDETSGTTRGSLQFIDRGFGSARSVSLGKTGPATYSVTVWAGSYDVRYIYTSGQTVVPQLEAGLQRGCLNVGACTASTGDVSGTWQLVFDASYTPGVLTLSQQGSTVTGSWVNLGTSTGFRLDPGTFQGGTLDVSLQAGGGTVMTFEGQLQSGCLMTGISRNISLASSQANFTGLRSQ